MERKELEAAENYKKKRFKMFTVHQVAILRSMRPLRKVCAAYAAHDRLIRIPCLENVKGRAHLRDLDVDGRAVRKCILRKLVVRSQLFICI